MALSFAAALVIGAPTLILPFGRDQSIHAVIAREALDGAVLYRDIFNVKPPLTTGVHALAQVLFGETVAAIRVMDILIGGLTAVILAWLFGRHSKLALSGLFAGISFAALYFRADHWNTAQTDGWTCLFMSGAVLAYSLSLDRKAAVRVGFLAFSGMLVAAAFWLKYTTALVLLVFPVSHLFLGIRLSRAMKDAGALTLGAAAGVAAGLVWMAASGGLGAFIDTMIFLEGYVALRADLTRMLGESFVFNIFFSSPLIAWVSLGGLALVLPRLPRHIGVPTVIWLVAAWLSGVIQGKGFSYQYLPTLAPLALLAGMMLTVIAVRLHQRVSRRVQIAVALSLSVLFVQAHSALRLWPEVMTVWLEGEPAKAAFWSRPEFNHTDYFVLSDIRLARYIENETLDCEEVFIWGYNPGVYFYADRRFPSRFLYSYPMVASGYRQSFREELVEALLSDPPVIFAVQHGDATPHVMGHALSSNETFEEFQALSGFVRGEYVPIGRIGMFDVYMREGIMPLDSRSCPV